MALELVQFVRRSPAAVNVVLLVLVNFGWQPRGGFVQVLEGFSTRSAGPEVEPGIPCSPAPSLGPAALLAIV